jgi:protease I
MKALILAAEGFEDLELFYPWFRLREEGLEVTVASPGGKTITGLHGYRVVADMPVREVNPSEYEFLVLPGGASPEKLRLREEAVGITRMFMDEDRPVVAIGRGAQLLISAGSLNGKMATSAPEIRDDLRAAGASYLDEAVVVDGNLLSCRGTHELPELCRQLISVLQART